MDVSNCSVVKGSSFFESQTINNLHDIKTAFIYLFLKFLCCLFFCCLLCIEKGVGHDPPSLSFGVYGYIVFPKMNVFSGCSPIERSSQYTAG